MNPLEQGRRDKRAPAGPRGDPAALRGAAGSAGGLRLLLPDPSGRPPCPGTAEGPRSGDVTARRTPGPVAPARWRCGMGSPAGGPAKRARCEGPSSPGSDPRLWDTERLCQHLARCGVGDPSLLHRFRGTAGRGRGHGRVARPLALTLLLLPQRAGSPGGCCWTCRPALPSSSASGERRPRGRGGRGPGAAAAGRARRERLYTHMARLGVALGRGRPKHLERNCAGGTRGNGLDGPIPDPRSSSHSLLIPAQPRCGRSLPK